MTGKPGSSFERDMLALLPALRRYSLSLSRSSDEGEDLLQDCCEKAIAARAGWRGGNLKSWLFTIMTNLHRTRLRAMPARRTALPLDEAEHVATESADSDPLARKHLIQALATLNPDGRAILMLVVLEGYSYAEVAEMLDIPIGTVMSRLSRARRKLGEVLEGANVVAHRRL